MAATTPSLTISAFVPKTCARLDDGASFVEEAVRRGQGQREDSGRELAHGCLCLRRRERFARSGAARYASCVSPRAVAAACAHEARAGAAKVGGAPAGLW